MLLKLTRLRDARLGGAAAELLQHHACTARAPLRWVNPMRS